ncbi:cupin domain-containing protein [Geodermatophilus marinus]|uniref:cupin domain-containing protein n=1 Tax=Geodermatophilus sp. LHW52908 TaxID=2303986 RepID=UPI000E3E810F|nr:cupin domain-containing protein [Geodermatophilus sp. LHW52908]RFU19124.1 cupin domain-containing protein [Geodermatophilus sp. LHW52908]
MTEKKSDFRVRRVVHGTGTDGRSTVLADRDAPLRLETPAFTIVDIWRFDGLPTRISADDGLPDQIELTPPSGSAVFRMCSIAPDEEWAGRSYDESLAAIGHEAAEGNGEETPPSEDGSHATDTVDVVVVLSGEVYCVTDTHETLLKQGDVVVQTGNAHSWSNRSDEVCKVAFVMATGTRDAG